MPISLHYDQVRLFAKAARHHIGRDVKHSTILKCLAHAINVPQDAMMHRLKTTPSATVLLDDPALHRLAKALDEADSKRVNNWTVAFLCQSVLDPIVIVDKFENTVIYFTVRQTGGDLKLFPNRPGDMFDDLGLEARHLPDVDRVANHLKFTNDHQNNPEALSAYSAPTLIAPFTVRLLLVADDPNRRKMADTVTLDRLAFELSRAFAGKGFRYIFDGSAFRRPNFTQVTDRGASLSRLGKPGAFPVLNDAGWALFQVEMFEASLQALASTPPGDWRKEVSRGEQILKNIKANPPALPIREYVDRLYKLHRALATIIETYEFLDLPIHEPRFEESQPIKQLIEEIILKERQQARKGNVAAREQFARLANRSMGLFIAVSHLLKEQQLPITFDRGRWLDAVWEIIANPGWTNFDDVATYVPKNPMTAYNGYRPTGWLAD
jgi:hypothetical protein